MKIKPIYLTFKQDEEEIREWIDTHSSASGYIKDLIKADMKKDNKNESEMKKCDNEMKFFDTMMD